MKISAPASNPRTLSEYSLLDPAVQSDPFEFYSVLHEQCPVYQMPETGFFVVTKYEDLRRVLSDYETFSNVVDRAKVLQRSGGDLYQTILQERGWSHMFTLQRTDPPLHARYRKLVDKVFTVKRVQELVPHIEAVAHNLITKFIDRGECDFFAEYALPLPGIIITEQLGLDRESLNTFAKWAEALLAPGVRILTEEELRAVAEIELECQHYLARVFEERRRHPQADLISGLVHAHQGENEEPLSVQELQSIMHQLITGGFESTPSAIGHGLWLLLRHPDQMARLRANRGLLRGYVDEVLRIESPVQGLRRRATRDVMLSDTLIPEGSIVITRYGAANRDPAKFPCPHQFDITRENAHQHLAFGARPHFCVGAVLAKQEITTAIATILDRLQDIALARPLDQPPHRPSLMFRPLKALPIRFTKIDPGS